LPGPGGPNQVFFRRHLARGEVAGTASRKAARCPLWTLVHLIRLRPALPLRKRVTCPWCASLKRPNTGRRTPTGDAVAPGSRASAFRVTRSAQVALQSMPAWAHRGSADAVTRTTRSSTLTELSGTAAPGGPPHVLPYGHPPRVVAWAQPAAPLGVGTDWRRLPHPATRPSLGTEPQATSGAVGSGGPPAPLPSYCLIRHARDGRTERSPI